MKRICDPSHRAPICGSLEAKWEAGRVVGREAAGGRGGGSKIPAQFCFVCFRSNCFFVYFFLCSLLS